MHFPSVNWLWFLNPFDWNTDNWLNHPEQSYDSYVSDLGSSNSSIFSFSILVVSLVIIYFIFKKR